jgi:cytidyltransferase-like protein
MSGSAGGSRIPKSNIEKTVKDYISKVISKFPGYKSFKISGSYNYSDKSDFGDIDLIIFIEGEDKKETKQKLADFLSKYPDNIIIPFKSEKYKGKKYLNTGEIVTILYPISGVPGQYVQIDNIISISNEEKEFKSNFLDYPADKQGLILGLTKIIALEEKPELIFKRLGIKNIPKLGKNQEYEFNLSGSGLTLRIVTLSKDFKESDRTEVWKSSSWDDVKKLLDGYNLDENFDDLLKTIKGKIKNPRSKNRIKGIFNSMVSIKSGEVNTAKGKDKQDSLDKVNQLLEKGKIKNLGEYLVASLLPEEFSESKRQTIALYPGKFKPPHKGHLEAVKLGLQKADKVIVIISQKQFEKYDDEQSKKIWELYKKSLGADGSRVEIRIAKEPSPIKTAYEVIESDPTNNYLAMYGKGEEGRWKALSNKDKYPNAEPFDLGSVESKNIKGENEVVSSTNLRAAIESGDRDKIRTYLPYGVDIDQYLNIINGDNEEDDIEEIKVNNPLPLFTIFNNKKNSNEVIEWLKTLNRIDLEKLYSEIFKYEAEGLEDENIRMDLYGYWEDPGMYRINEIKIIESRQTKKLKVFDFDNTLAHVNAKIVVTHKDGKQTKLSTSQYAKYESKEGDEFSFKEFNTTIKKAKPISNNIEKLKKSLDSPSVKTTILTARGLTYPVKKYLKDEFNIEPYIIGLGSSDPQHKAEWIEQQIKKGYNDIEFLDDSEKNIEAVDKLKEKYPDISLKTQLIKEVKINNPSNVKIEDVSDFIIYKLRTKNISDYPNLDDYNKVVIEYNELIQRYHSIRNRVEFDNKITPESQQYLNDLYKDLINFYNKQNIKEGKYHNKLVKMALRKDLDRLTDLGKEYLPAKSGINPEIVKTIKKLVDYCCEDLKISKPEIILINSDNYATKNKSFGGYSPSEKKIYLSIKNRNLADCCRTLSHELKHHEQNLNGRLTLEAGKDGDIFENEANAYSGKVMRQFGRENPEIYNIVC